MKPLSLRLRGFTGIQKGLGLMDEEEFIESFTKLWDSLNGKKYAWGSNPTVWVIEFRRII